MDETLPSRKKKLNFAEQPWAKIPPVRYGPPQRVRSTKQQPRFKNKGAGRGPAPGFASTQHPAPSGGMTIRSVPTCATGVRGRARIGPAPKSEEQHNNRGRWGPRKGRVAKGGARCQLGSRVRPANLQESATWTSPPRTCFQGQPVGPWPCQLRRTAPRAKETVWARSNRHDSTGPRGHQLYMTVQKYRCNRANRGNCGEHNCTRITKGPGPLHTFSITLRYGCYGYGVKVQRRTSSKRD